MVSEAGARGVIEACSCRMRPEFISTTMAAAMALPLERFFEAASAELDGAAIASASKSTSHARGRGPQKLLSSRNFTPSPKACSASPPSFRIPYRTQETRALAHLAGATWFGRRLKSGDCQSVKADKFDLLCSAKIFVDRLLCNAYIRFTTLGSFFPERAYNAQRFRRVSESG